jgi:adenylyl-sulfate kinase
MDAQQSAGFVIWITGMERAGKSTLANHVARRLAASGRRVEVLDGDEPGNPLTGGAGTTQEERQAVTRRLGHVAKLLARNGVVAVCAALSPFRESRELIRKEIRRVVEVFVDCPMETLLARDAGGLYEKALRGELKNVVGIDDPYEPPAHADVVIHSHEETVEQESSRILQALVDIKYIGPAEFGRATGGQRPRRAKPARAARKAARGKMAAKAASRKAPKKLAARTAKVARRARR